MIDPIVNEPIEPKARTGTEELRSNRKDQLLKAIEEQKRRNQAL